MRYPLFCLPQEGAWFLFYEPIGKIMPFAARIVLYAPVLYLDPGSGSLLVQLLLAAGLGIGVAVRIYWNKIKALFHPQQPGSEDPSEKEDPPEEPL